MDTFLMIITLLSWLALGWCIVFCMVHFFRLVKQGKVKDLSQKSGNITQAVVYSNTTAMMPSQKESAYKHLPTFTAGIVYHIGTFLSLSLFVLSLIVIIGKDSWNITRFLFDGWWFLVGTAVFLLFGFLCGFSLLLKRIFSKKLRPFSNFDDYFSNGIVTLFQFFSFALLAILIFATRDYPSNIFFPPINLVACTVYGYFITATILFIYLPFGKLKHAVYYFAARYHLGFFYGWRNTWPPKKEKQ